MLEDEIEKLASTSSSGAGEARLTAAAFLAGLMSVYFAAYSYTSMSLVFWFLNRVFDCLDGSLARHRGTASDLGGFMDLLSDFIIYSLLPIAVALRDSASDKHWLSVAILEATFFINNFVLFYIAAVAEKQNAAAGADGKARARAKELTSVSMKPALIEGAESAAFFTAMLAFPQHIELLSWMMAFLIIVGTSQRIMYLVPVLR
ncbi:MAG: hypothetical protein LQ338_007983 [Usnochroma carphineum]|nr:MAG: hypothetical protein LQ338_007983 [Usnochroma carphineum]